MICECDNEYPSGYRGTFQHFYSTLSRIVNIFLIARTIFYVKPSVTGSVVGLVGAGGSLGGVMFSLIFRYSASYQKGFITMGVIAAASSLLTPFIQIPGQTSLLCRPCGRFTDLLEQRSLHSVAQASVQSTRSARFGAPTTTVTVAANGRTT